MKPEPRPEAPYVAGLPPILMTDLERKLTQEVERLRTENHGLLADLDMTEKMRVEGLAALQHTRAVVQAAREFVQHHLHGQPGQPGTLYPMTYGVQNQWHTDWDYRLETLIGCIAALDAAAAAPDLQAPGGT